MAKGKYKACLWFAVDGHGYIITPGWKDKSYLASWIRRQFPKAYTDFTYRKLWVSDPRHYTVTPKPPAARRKK